MNDEQDTIDIADTMEDTPEEARDFLFGDAIQSVRTAINTQLQNEAQTDLLMETIDLYVLGEKEFDDLSETIDQLPVGEEQKQAVRNIIQTQVIDELIAIVQAHTEIEEENNTALEPATPTTAIAPSPADVLASLKARMTMPSAIAPAARELPPGPTTAAPAVPPPANLPTAPTPPPAASSSAKPKIDLYREPVEK